MTTTLPQGMFPTLAETFGDTFSERASDAQMRTMCTRLANAIDDAIAAHELIDVQRELIIEDQRKVAELQVKTLEETLKRQAEHILSLEKALEEAKRQVQEIALKAIEGASGSRALAHVNQIAIEQAKGRPQG